MSYVPIEKIVSQYVDGNGKPYSGAVLKAYAAGTTRNISFAIDTSGNTLSSTIILNASGYPTVSGNIVIPHLDQNFKLALYPNQTSADSDTNPVWMTNDIAISNTTLSGGQLTGVGNGTTRDSAASVGQIQDGGLLYLGTTTGVDNGYIASPSPAITAYNNKMAFSVKIHATNTINPKPYLQLNNIANPTTNAVIKKFDASKAEIDIEASDMLAGGIYKYQRNSTDNAWILLNPEKSFFINPSIASANNIVKASFSGYGVSYLERPVETSDGSAVNSINFSKGIFNFDDGSGQAVLESNMVKHLYTTAWEKGTGKGGLFGGTPSGTLIGAEKFYHGFVIYNPTTGEVDCGFDTGLDAPNKPTGFTKYKRVRSLRTGSDRNIMQGTSIYDRKGGYHFTYNNPVQDIYHINGGLAKTSKEISVPSVPVLAYMRAVAEQDSAGAYFYLKLFQSNNGDEPIINSGALNAGISSSSGYIPTENRSIFYQYGAAGGSGKVRGYTLGWYDPCLYTPAPLDFHLAPLGTTNGNTTSNNTSSGSANPGGSNSQIQYNKNGLFGGNAGLTYDEATNSVSVTGNIKLGALTPSTLLTADLNKNIQSLPLLTYPSLDEIARIKGLSTQLQPKLADLETELLGKAPNAIFTGANDVTDGTNGLVPKPLIIDRQKYLKGDGTWGSFSPAGSNNQIQFNDNGAFGGSSSFVYDKVNDILTLNKINCNTILSTERLSVRNDFIVNRLTINEKISIKDVNLGTSLFVIKVGEALTAERNLTLICDDSDVNLNLKHAANPFVGTTGSVNGTKGLVPAPTTSDLGKFLKGDGTWSTVSSGSTTNPGGSSTQVQFNDGGVFGGSSSFTFNKATNTLTVTNIVSDTIDGKANDAAFTGATVSIDGSRGLVPKPFIADKQKFLKGDGTWSSVDIAINPSGSNTQIQFNDGGSFAGNSNFTFDKTTNTLNVTNITSNSLTSLQASITNNSNSITSLQTTVSNNSSSITTLQGQVTTNANSITTLQGQVTTNSSSISSLQTTVASKADNTNFTGATVSTNGVKGLVPVPLIADRQKFLKGDGTWSDVTSSSTNPAGSDTQVQFNDGGAFGANAGFTYNKTTNVLTVGGNINCSALQAQLDAKAPIASPTFTGTVKGVSIPFSFAISDETTAITTGTSKITFRAPYACTLTAVRASLSTASTSGNPTFDINKNAVSMLSTTLSIDANEKTSVTAATSAVISTSSIADDDEITIDIDTAGTGAKGAKITLYLTRV